MSLVQITLSMAQQNLVEVVFNSLQSVKAEVAPMVKHIRKGLGTKDTRKRIDRFNNAAIHLGFAVLSWSDLVDPSDYGEFLEEQLELATQAVLDTGEQKTATLGKRVGSIAKLAEKLHHMSEEQEFSVDTLYLRWLRDLVNDPAKIDLARRVSISPNGQVHEMIVPPSADMIEVFAELLEKLGDALAVVKEISAVAAAEISLNRPE